MVYGIEIIKNVLVLFVVGFFYEFVDYVVQMVVMGFGGFGVDVVQFDQFWVYVVEEVVVFVQYIGEIIGYISIKVVFGVVQDGNVIVGYVFIVVIVGVFYYGVYVGVMYIEMFVGGVGGEQFVFGGVI